MYHYGSLLISRYSNNHISHIECHVTGGAWWWNVLLYDRRRHLVMECIVIWYVAPSVDVVVLYGVYMIGSAISCVAIWLYVSNCINTTDEALKLSPILLLISKWRYKKNSDQTRLDQWTSHLTWPKSYWFHLLCRITVHGQCLSAFFYLIISPKFENFGDIMFLVAPPSPPPHANACTGHNFVTNTPTNSYSP